MTSFCQNFQKVSLVSISLKVGTYLISEALDDGKTPPSTPSKSSLLVPKKIRNEGYSFYH